MSRAANGGGGRGAERRCRYRGVRRRAWGKWVSEIRVPGTRERLWLGSYAAPEAAAVAHDAAACLLRGLAGAAAAGHLNFPERAACYGHGRAPRPLSPRSVQRVASDAGMAADAQLVDARAAALAASSTTSSPPRPTVWAAAGTTAVAASVGIGGAARGGEGAGYAPVPALPPHSNCSSSSSTYWATPSAGGGSRSSSAGSDQQLVYGDISVDDIEILM
ncbi:unnamed protein product [Urochloa decumbens]|uniref:AP2/ERF domain-containing protein n=1 Tax=Urochloa decumbens TaxID=240449 RepID=A0ABC8W0U1_9POAL